MNKEKLVYKHLCDGTDGDFAFLDEAFTQKRFVVFVKRVSSNDYTNIFRYFLGRWTHVGVVSSIALKPAVICIEALDTVTENPRYLNDNILLIAIKTKKLQQINKFIHDKMGMPYDYFGIAGIGATILLPKLLSLFPTNKVLNWVIDHINAFKYVALAQRRNQFFCSELVATAIHDCDSELYDKLFGAVHPSKITPPDFFKLEE